MAARRPAGQGLGETFKFCTAAVRGFFCTRCAGFVCGMQNCWECVPEEQMLLNMEAKGRQDAQAATDDAERVCELLHVSSQEAFSQMVASLYAQRQQGIEYRERVNSNIRAIRGL